MFGKDDINGMSWKEMSFEGNRVTNYEKALTSLSSHYFKLIRFIPAASLLATQRICLQHETSKL
jgi:hypothetical protein